MSIRGEQYLLGLICIYSWLTPIHSEFIQLFPPLSPPSIPLSLFFQMKIKILASLLLYQVGLVASVVSPLELVSQELQEMKETSK